MQTKRLIFTVVIIAALMANTFAYAAQSVQKAAPGGAGKPDATAAKKVGNESEPLVKNGLFLEADPGAYFSVGGKMGTSLSAPYVNIIFGYNFGPSMSLGLAGGFAANNNNAPSNDLGTYLQSYMTGMIDVNFSYNVRVIERLAIPLRVFAGVSFVTDKYTEIINSVGDVTGISEKLTIQPNVGFATGVQYTTWQKHLQIGLEVAFFYTILDAIPALAVYPVIKYNF
jgi:hypothetical protein